MIGSVAAMVPLTIKQLMGNVRQMKDVLAEENEEEDGNGTEMTTLSPFRRGEIDAESQPQGEGLPPPPLERLPPPHEEEGLPPPPHEEEEGLSPPPPPLRRGRRRAGSPLRHRRSGGGGRSARSSRHTIVAPAAGAGRAGARPSVKSPCLIT